MQKLDIKQSLAPLYQPKAKSVVVVDVPELAYLMVDGNGDPNHTLAYREAVEALFSVSYTLKFMAKQGDLAIDYGVMPLEGLWWAEDMTQFSTEDKSNWLWTMMILQPAFVTEEMVAAAMSAVRKRRIPRLDKLRFARYEEGTCAQILHIGPFSEEGPTIAKVHEYIDTHGHKLRGKHHEIYLSDIRRAAPDKWKTIIRQPFG
ncbi:MAG: GyrI-like domain-containing protein [Caldilineaceae bacterium]